MQQKEYWPGSCFDGESFFTTEVNIKPICSITGIISISYRIFKSYLIILGNQTIFCLTSKSPLVIPLIQIQTQKEAKKNSHNKANSSLQASTFNPLYL